MDRIHRAAAVSLGLLSLLVAALPNAAEAQRGAIVVVVDSAERSVQADAVRAALSDRLEVGVLSLLDDAREGTLGTLQVAVARGGSHVELCFQTDAGRRRFHAASAPGGVGGAAWVAEAAASFVSAQVVERRWSLPSEVLDPFEPPSGRRTPAPATEVIDPWEVPWSPSRRSDEPGTRLAPPPAPRR